MIISEAYTAVGQILDDENNRRWTAAQVQAALAPALSRCLNLYQEKGGDRFDLESSQTTSATDGSVDISTLVPMVVKDVGIVSGSVTWRIPAKQKMRRGYTDATARTILILYAREYALSTTTSHPLVGVGSAEANSWSDFDNWICAEAALKLAIKELEGPRLDYVKAQCADIRESVLGRCRIPGGYPWPRREWSPYWDWVSWQWKPSTSKINTVREAW